VQGKYETLLAEDRPNDILLVTFNRPEVANAFNTLAAVELCDVFRRIEAEQKYRCAVLTGVGEKAFCAGADLKERNSLGDEEWRAQHKTFERMFASVRDCALPVLAAVNGAAYAGGLELVLLCDFAYASRSARFALTEVSLGIMPGGGGTQTLARAAGERRAKELILAARPFSAEEALAWRSARRHTRGRGPHLFACTPLGAAGEARDSSWLAYGSCVGHAVRGGSVQQACRNRGPQGGSPRFQREAQAELQGPLMAAEGRT
jgi:enoyl-CoA hydratase/carnithine racemase